VFCFAVNRLAVDGSDARALPLLLVKEWCSDCSGRPRPAVWIASCCGAFLCPSCLESGLRRRHGGCTTPCVLGLVGRARATFQSAHDGSTFYVFREVRLALRQRVGDDLLAVGRYVIRYCVSLADLHDRRLHRRNRPARRLTLLYCEAIVGGLNVLLQLTL
jgi:hypothetical protein